MIQFDSCISEFEFTAHHHLEMCCNITLWLQCMAQFFHYQCIVFTKNGTCSDRRATLKVVVGRGGGGGGGGGGLIRDSKKGGLKTHFLVTLYNFQKRGLWGLTWYCNCSNILWCTLRYQYAGNLNTRNSQANSQQNYWFLTVRWTMAM